MPKVSVFISATFRIGEKDAQWAKIQLEAIEVDTEVELQQQLQSVGKTMDAVYAQLRNSLDAKIDEILDTA